VLVAVGRTTNGKRIGLENADIDVSDRGVIPVDKQMRTSLPHVFAIGDIVPGPCWLTRRCTRPRWRLKSPPATRVTSTRA
jgi:pyruvate/2-oxoglutarate dehydrogenase complex dihydrolipoamide dehydrogenase (E3) component